MIGGSMESFIGPIHRIASNIDGNIELVCGNFSSNAKKSKDTGRAIGLEDKRIYNSYAEMITAESKLPDEEKMHFVSIVTPNYEHFQPAKLSLEHGFHVICEKPLCITSNESKILAKIAKEKKLIVCVTYNYTGYPMVKEAKDYISKNRLGKIRKIIIEYLQGWLSTKKEENHKQAAWRTDPLKAGIGGCIVDIGTHAENLCRYVTGLNIQEISADITSFVPDRKLDDDANILLRFDNGAKGAIIVSQVAAGEDNNLNFKIYGEKGSMHWYQENPTELIIKHLDEPQQRIHASKEYLKSESSKYSRTPPGHPEGYIESFANIYNSFATRILHNEPNDFPDVIDGLHSMFFIESVINSARNNSSWTEVSHYKQ